MKKFLKIFLGILFLALLVGTFVFLWNKTRPVKVVYTLATPVRDTIRQYVIASGKVNSVNSAEIRAGVISSTCPLYFASKSKNSLSVTTSVKGKTNLTR